MAIPTEDEIIEQQSRDMFDEYERANGQQHPDRAKIEKEQAEARNRRARADSLGKGQVPPKGGPTADGGKGSRARGQESKLLNMLKKAGSSRLAQGAMWAGALPIKHPVATAVAGGLGAAFGPAIYDALKDDDTPAAPDEPRREPPTPWDRQYLPENGEGPKTFSNGVARPEYIRDGSMAGFGFGNGQQALIEYADDPDGTKNAAFQERLRKSISEGMYDRKPVPVDPTAMARERLAQEAGLRSYAELQAAQENSQALNALANLRGRSGGGGGLGKALDTEAKHLFPEDPIAAYDFERTASKKFAGAADPTAAALIDHVSRRSNNFGGLGEWSNFFGDSTTTAPMNWIEKDDSWFGEDYKYGRGGDGVFGLDLDAFDKYPEPYRRRVLELLDTMVANSQNRPR